MRVAKAAKLPLVHSQSLSRFGIQIVGPFLEDATPIDVAGRLTEVTGGFQPPPGF